MTTAELDLDAPLRSVSIAMGVLGCFERAAELGATAVATELGIAKSTACRMLAALAASGMLERTSSGRYRFATCRSVSTVRPSRRSAMFMLVPASTTATC